MTLTKENIKEHVDVDPDTGCWNWKHGKAGKNYGTAWFDGKQCYVHRMIYKLFIGPIPDGFDVCHHCDNPPCCNPSHLFVGTRNDNMQDAIRKGRMASGERHGTHTHPERIARGDRSGARTHPEKIPYGEPRRRRGEKNGRSVLTESNVLNIRRRYANGNVFQRELAIEYGVAQTVISCIILRKNWKHI